MAQVNPTVGDLRGNASLILDYARRAASAEAELVIFPELALSGYPPEDLLLKPAFIEDNLRALDKLSKELQGITAIVGLVDRLGAGIGNAAAIIHDGAVAGVYHKMDLPNYGVFDEKRYFTAGDAPLNLVFKGITMGLGVCEDIWTPEGPARLQAQCGASVIININASPYHMGKAAIREKMLRERAIDNDVFIIYNNMVGGQDELVFDGRGLIINSGGEVLARTKAFAEDLLLYDLETSPLLKKTAGKEEGRRGKCVETITLRPLAKEDKKALPPREVGCITSSNEEVYKALVLGTRDYALKNRFTHAVIALSGGIDSALVAVVAAEALGSENISCVFMPSKYTSAESINDAAGLAENLGLSLMRLPIDRIFSLYLDGLAPFFGEKRPDVTEENLQARIRGDIVMALSNKFGWLVLTTGNKSEMSVGYATLYGDMAGGFAVIKDVPKTLVYEISEWLNAESERRGEKPPIPAGIITKAPSAELKEGQKDEDTLLPYDELDTILKAYVEDDHSLAEIAEMGFSREEVKRVIDMVDRSEYKRRQAAPGIKITPRAFGRDRRMPITNRYNAGAVIKGLFS